MGRLNSTGIDEALTSKMRKLLERSFESPYESKGKGPVMSYEKFVQLLDTEDPVAQKAIDIIVQDVFTRARSRKQAIEEARNYHHQQPSYSAIAAAAAARRDQVGGAEARRAWHGEVPSLSQRLHGWRYLNAETPDGDSSYRGPAPNRTEETSEYDAIIADAQRQVASPLPLLNFATGSSGSQDNHNNNQHDEEEEPLFDSSDWPDLNPGLNSNNVYGGHSSTYFSDDEDSEIEEHRSRLRAVESALAAVRAQRDTARTNLTRLSTIQGNGNGNGALLWSSSSNINNVTNSASSRLRILQRLEQSRRDLMERAEHEHNTSNTTTNTNANRSYPSYFNTSFQRTSTENADRAAPPPANERFQPSIPIIVGGDFSTLPTASNVSTLPGSEAGTTQTLRASYGPLQRNNSIRRSGFHAYRGGQQSSPPNANAALSAANALLPRVSQRPLSVHRPRTPIVPVPVGEPSSGEAPTTTQRQQLDTLFGRHSSAEPWEREVYHGNEVGSFEDFSRNARQASRGARDREEEEEGGESRDDRPSPVLHNGRLIPGFSLSVYDPMLGSASLDGGADSVTELLGSSSSVAGLGNMNGGTSSSTTAAAPRGPSVAPDGRRSIVPPRAPILSRRSFPLESPAVMPGASADSANTLGNATAQASNASSTLAPDRPSPQRATSVPERRPIHRPGEVVSLGYFLNVENSQSPQQE